MNRTAENNGHGKSAFMRSNVCWVIWFAAASVSVVLALLYGFARPYMFDDSIFLFLSEELAAGRNPYEFHDSKLPGLYAMVAAFMRVVGHSVYTGRLFSWILMGLTAIVTAWLPRGRIGALTRCWIGLLTFVMLWFAEGSVLLTESGVALFGALGFLALSFGTRSVWTVFLAGCAMGLAFAFKQVALGFPVGVLGVWGVAVIGRRLPVLQAAKLGAAHVAGFAVVTAVVWLAIAHHGMAAGAWTQCFVYMSGYERWLSVEEATFLGLRIGWFLVPALLLPLVRLLQGRLSKDPEIFLMASAVILIQLYPYTRRLYAHYIMSVVPVIVLTLWFGVTWYKCVIFRKTRASRICIIGVTVVALIGVICGGWIKRTSLERIVLGKHRANMYTLASGIGRYVTSPQDKALFLYPGPHGTKSDAMYYYSGVRPAWPFFHLHDIPAHVIQPWVEKLPEILERSDIAVVTFAFENKTSRYYPISGETQSAIEQVILRDYKRAPELGSEYFWVRKDAVKGSVEFHFGPYAVRDGALP